MTEILAPAGNLKVALDALNSHADAIYVGLESFSARRGASNFSRLEFRRALGHARSINKKVYVAINTVVLEDELEELFDVLNFLNTLEVDAIIIQDLGVLNIIQTYFPSLEIHASTQMGIHNEIGARKAFELGIKRVVLSRETTYETIRKIRSEVPELELEVFIHGALCYSFSGMCLASGLILDRSGNRGACAQICRTFFEKQAGESGHYFSCNDLALYENVKKLKDIGVHSFKIEGRMKSSSYVVSLLELYDSILNDSCHIRPLAKSLLTFSRNTTLGFFDNSSGNELINSNYAGHTGMSFAKVTKVEKDLILYDNKQKLEPFSSIAIFRNGKFIVGDLIKSLNKNRNGFYFSDTKKVLPGDEIRLLADKKQKEVNIDEKSFPYSSRCIDVEVILTNTEIVINKDSELVTIFPFEVQESKNKDNVLEMIESSFMKVGESLFTFSISNFENESEAHFPFVPSSVLKKVKKELNNIFTEKLLVKMPSVPKVKIKKGFEYRKALFLNTGFPFVQDEADLIDYNLPCVDGVYYIPLSPLDFDEAFLHSLEEFIKDKKVVIGISNLSHLAIVDHLKDSVSYFVDFYLYLANSFAVDFILKHIPKVKFAYGFCEMKNVLPALTDILDTEVLPLFLSKGCFKKHNESDCQGCPKDFSATLTNNGEFVVMVKRCITYLFRN